MWGGGIKIYYAWFLASAICGNFRLKRKWVSGVLLVGWRRPVRRADNLTTFTCRMSKHLNSSTSWNPQGLARPIQGMFYLLIRGSEVCFCQGRLARRGITPDYLFTPWSRDLSEKLTGSQLVKFPYFMEPEGSLQHSQVVAIRPYPEPAWSNPCPHTQLPEDPS
jgi:hypothetical protein